MTPTTPIGWYSTLAAWLARDDRDPRLAADASGFGLADLWQSEGLYGFLNSFEFDCGPISIALVAIRRADANEEFKCKDINHVRARIRADLPLSSQYCTAYLAG